MGQLEGLQIIKKILPKYQSMLIGIDGFGGSGKTTLARYLMSSIQNSRIIEMDDFYSPEFDRPDYQRVFQQVIKPITLNKSFKYQIYDWKRKRHVDSELVTIGDTIIMEGVFALENSIREYYDYTIWVDCDQTEAMKRGIARNLIEDGIDSREKWENIWYPAELRYVNEQKPDEFADCLFKQNF